MYKKCDPACLTKLTKFVPFKKKKMEPRTLSLMFKTVVSVSTFQFFAFFR